jgi:hypothetical protein
MAGKPIRRNLIKLADKISNVRFVATSPPVEWSNHRRRDYIEFCAAVVNQLRGASPILEAEFDAVREMASLSVAVDMKRCVESVCAVDCTELPVGPASLATGDTERPSSASSAQNSLQKNWPLGARQGCNSPLTIGSGLTQNAQHAVASPKWV